jgi:hypothetical protein
MEQFSGGKQPPYAILSDTLGDPQDEATYSDFRDPDISTKKAGYREIKLMCDEAAAAGIYHAWVDTCYLCSSHQPRQCPSVCVALATECDADNSSNRAVRLALVISLSGKLKIQEFNSICLLTSKKRFSNRGKKKKINARSKRCDNSLSFLETSWSHCRAVGSIRQVCYCKVTDYWRASSGMKPLRPAHNSSIARAKSKYNIFFNNKYFSRNRPIGPMARRVS